MPPRAPRPVSQRLGFKGRYKLKHYRNGLFLAEYEAKNAVTDAAVNRIFNEYFRNGTPSAAFYLGIINNASFSALSNSDTMASHAGWIEFTGYSQSTRVAWSPDAASARSITNSTPAQFDVTGSATLYGLFVVDNSTKSGTTGNLWSTAAFNSGTVSVTSGDVLKLTYSLSA
jgi:hypothetical protein